MALYNFLAEGFGYLASGLNMGAGLVGKTANLLNPYGWYNWIVGPCPANDFICEYTDGKHKLPEWILNSANKLAAHTGISPSITVPATAVAAAIGIAYTGKALHDRSVQDNKAVIESFLRKIFGPIANRLYAPFEKAIQDATNHYVNKINESTPLPPDATHLEKAKRMREARKIALKEMRANNYEQILKLNQTEITRRLEEQQEANQQGVSDYLYNLLFVQPEVKKQLQDQANKLK